MRAGEGSFQKRFSPRKHCLIFLFFYHTFQSLVEFNNEIKKNRILHVPLPLSKYYIIIMIIIIALQYRKQEGYVEKQHGNKRQLY